METLVYLLGAQGDGEGVPGVSGTVTIGTQNIAADRLDALIVRARQGSFEIVKAR